MHDYGLLEYCTIVVVVVHTVCFFGHKFFVRGTLIINFFCACAAPILNDDFPAGETFGVLFFMY